MPCRSCTAYVDASLAGHGRAPRWLGPFDVGAWPEIDELSIGDLRAVEHAGIPVGRLVEIPVKWFLLADAIDDDPLGPITYRHFLRSARAILDRAAALLDDVRPDQVLMLNGLFLFESMVWELCKQRRIPVVTYERGFILDSFFFARDEAAGLSNMSPVWPEWADRPLTADESARLDTYLDDRRHGRRTADQYWRDVRFDVDSAPAQGSRALLLTNLVWDSAVIGQEVAFASIVDWIEATIDVFRGRPDDELVIRVHPAEVKLPGRESRETMEVAIARRVERLPPNVRVVAATDPTSSYTLMADADVGLVYSSTTGLEMALAGKPVIVAAQTHYRDKGFTVDVRSAEDFRRTLVEALDDPERWAPDVERARRYAYLFFFRAPYVGLGVAEHIRGLVRLTATAADDLRPGASADLDRFCDRLLGGLDFGHHAVDVPAVGGRGPDPS
jgi:glycosyltransferase involved in cell wall biosynthesis